MTAESLILARGVPAEVQRRSVSKDALGGQVTDWILRGTVTAWFQPASQDRQRREGADRNLTTHVAHLQPAVEMNADDRLVAVIRGVTRTFRVNGRTRPGELVTGDLARCRVDCYEEGAN